MSTPIESATIAVAENSETIKSVVIDIIKDGKELIDTHAPAAIQDILTWAYIQPFLILPLFVIAVPLFIFGFRNAAKIIKEDGRALRNGHEIPYIVLCVVSGILGVVSFIMLCVSVSNAAHAYFAPYSYLINKFT